MTIETKVSSELAGMDLTGQREFAVRLTLELARTEGNLFVSPFSAWCLLALLHPGARGETRAALSRVLGLPGGEEEESWIKELKELRSGLMDLKPRTLGWLGQLEVLPESSPMPEDYDLIVANALWLQEEYALKPEYLTLIRDGFDALVEKLDLVGDSEKACRTINRWADENTRGKISEVLSPGEIHPLTRLILANATYFKDDWADKFDPEATRDQRFHRLKGSRVRVPMMHQTTDLDFFEDRTLQAVRLPYAHEGLSMIVVLPKRIRKFEASLSPESLEQLFEAITQQSLVHLALPRCRFRDNLQLVPTLTAMGLGSLFDEAADLSGISTEPGIYVNQVKQLTFVQVDEEGTEAAAVTTAEMITATPVARRQKPKKMIVDRPYWFFIRHDPSKCLLFAGREEDPS